jgi:hypothetical protein
MRSSLVPCTVCRRHVHLDDGVCPFCGGAVVATLVPASTTKLISRAAMMALATTLVPACSSSDPSPVADTGVGDTFVSIDAAYGGPPDSSPGPLYGGPVFDTAMDDTSMDDTSTADAADGD